MKKRRTFLLGIIAGIILILSPLFGLLAAAIGMGHAFSLLGHPGISDPKAVSADIGGVLVSTAVGLILCPVGVILFTVSLIFYLRTAKTTWPAQHGGPVA